MYIASTYFKSFNLFLLVMEIVILFPLLVVYDECLILSLVHVFEDEVVDDFAQLRLLVP